MLFNSYVFILLFLPMCLIGYFGLNYFGKHNVAQLFLLGMSLWFYGFFNASYLTIIIMSIVMNYLSTCLMDKTKSKFLKTMECILMVGVNVGILFYFKYYDFFIENINILFHKEYTLNNVILPLGISFFTFQQMSYVIDYYKGEVKPYGFLQYASFVTYFPQLIAGPIVTHDELIPQFMNLEKKKINWDNFSAGMYMFVLGLGKKVLIADTFGNAVNWGFSNIELLDTTNAVLVALSYTIQIYYDFSGYCDMAIGIGKMMNIDLPVNFDSPYKSLTITEFWKRWHKTLTRFFTKYVYIPLGGNRKGKIRTYINVMIIFTVSGLWHGANWTFILWGMIHGIFMVITRHFKKWFEKIHPALNWVITFVFINFTWILFRANTIKDACEISKRIIKLNFGPINENIVDVFNLTEFLKVFKYCKPINILDDYPNILVLFAFVFTFILMLGAQNANEKMQKFCPTLLNLLITAILLIWCIMSLSGISTFLYFNF